MGSVPPMGSVRIRVLWGVLRAAIATLCLSAFGGCSFFFDQGDDSSQTDGGPVVDAASVDGTPSTCYLDGNPDEICSPGICDLRNRTCIDESRVVFLGPVPNATPACGEFRDAPCSDFENAIRRADELGRNIIHVRDAIVDVVAVPDTVPQPLRVIGFGAQLTRKPGVAAGSTFTVEAGARVTIEGLTIVGISAPPAFAGVHVRRQGDLEIYRATITGHGGAGILHANTNPSVADETRLRVESSKIIENGLANAAPGVSISDGVFSIRNTEISGGLGRGLNVDVPSVTVPFVLELNTIVGNVNPSRFGPTDPALEVISIVGIILDQIPEIEMAGSVEFRRSWPGQMAGIEPVAEIPLFIDSAGGDYRLNAESPGIDFVTSPAPGLDANGRPRPRGAAHEVGAYEREP